MCILAYDSCRCLAENGTEALLGFAQRVLGTASLQCLGTVLRNCQQEFLLFLIEGPGGAYLAIPTAFASWTGDALDQKIPLLRSINALNAPPKWRGDPGAGR